MTLAIDIIVDIIDGHGLSSEFLSKVMVYLSFVNSTSCALLESGCAIQVVKLINED